VKIYADVLQGSDQWHALRLGIPTASAFDKIVTAKRCDLSAGAHAYALRLVAERLLNQPTAQTGGDFSGPWMERGKELEPDAVRMYEWQYEAKTFPVGFITTDDGRIGCSPDRLVLGGKVALEIKCPSPQVHLGYLLDGTADEYRPQVQGQILVAELERAELFAYHPQMPPAHIVNKPDAEYQAKLHSALSKFVDLLDEMQAKAIAIGAFQPIARATTPVETIEMAEIAAAFKAETAMKMAKEGFTA
jgi:hypothetical protein